LTANATAEETLLCQNSYDKKPFAYLHSSRGKVVVYETPSSYTPTPEDLVCATIKQFWLHKDKFPRKLTVLVVRGDYMNAMILQINMVTDTMMIAPVNIPYTSDPPVVKTIWTIFPDPMKRLTEMIRLETLPIVKGEVKANYAWVSQAALVYLATGYAVDSKGQVRLEARFPERK